MEDDSSPSPSFKHSVLTAVMTQKYSEKLFITPADAALGLCTWQYMTQQWLTGDTACNRPGDTVLKWAVAVVSLSCTICVVRELRGADSLACQSSTPGARAQGFFWSHQGRVSFRVLTLTYTHKNTTSDNAENYIWTHSVLSVNCMCITIWLLYPNQFFFIYMLQLSFYQLKHDDADLVNAADRNVITATKFANISIKKGKKILASSLDHKSFFYRPTR